MGIKGFFSGSELAQVKAPPSLVPKCGACGLYKNCQSPKQFTYGKGGRKILLVGSSPSKQEDIPDNNPLSSKGVRELDRALAKVGIDLEEDCWLNNALICYPNETRITNAHIQYCRPNIIKQIKQLNPKGIILLGNEAVASVIGWLWKSDPGGINQWSGWQIPSQKLNAWICPTFNPAYVLRVSETDKTQRGDPIPRLLFEKQLKSAVELAQERPWETLPDWQRQVDIVTDPDKAATYLRRMIAKGGSVAFDYETNMLKPEGKGARIVSCAVCWNGKKTIAFPWHGAAIEAMVELIRSPLPKIAANLKFEDRWTRRLLGTGVRNWWFDTMLGAHVIDSRSGTKSLKFQAFVHLGMDSYNDHIEGFFQAKGTMKPNRITDIGLEDLLLYNGLDALLEYKLARCQMEILECPFPEGMK